MVPEVLDFSFKKKKEEGAEERLASVWRAEGRAGLCLAACEALYKLCIYYFLLTIKIKCTRCFCIQYTFNPADLDFSGFKSGGELAGFPTFPSSPHEQSTKSLLSIFSPGTAGPSLLCVHVVSSLIPLLRAPRLAPPKHPRKTNVIAEI